MSDFVFVQQAGQNSAYLSEFVPFVFTCRKLTTHPRTLPFLGLTPHEQPNCRTKDRSSELNRPLHLFMTKMGKPHSRGKFA